MSHFENHFIQNTPITFRYYCLQISYTQFLAKPFFTHLFAAGYYLQFLTKVIKPRNLFVLLFLISFISLISFSKKEQACDIRVDFTLKVLCYFHLTHD